MNGRIAPAVRDGHKPSAVEDERQTGALGGWHPCFLQERLERTARTAAARPQALSAETPAHRERIRQAVKINRAALIGFEGESTEAFRQL
jgi:hypothetical protein